MSEYTDYGMIEAKLREGMYAGNMHACLRDVGRIAGGHVAAGRLSQDECDRLGAFAVSMAINKAEATRKWAEATAFGRKQPLAKSSPVPFDGGHAVGWDEVVNPNDYRVVDEKWLQTEAVVEPDSWNPCKELSDYLNALFDPTDRVMFCTDPWNKDGRWVPNKGACKTVEEMMKSLRKDTKDGFEEAVGTPNEESGAWIRINPFDGEGCKDENVTDYRYALIESDDKPIDEQVAIYRKMELPCACIVNSGGKSAHAIVRIGASSLDEYRKRVNFLYGVCESNGLTVDKQNRNPSRYSRMPGVMRNGKKQYLISLSCGKKDWDEWENWINDVNDDLPDFEPLTLEEIMNPPPLTPELIEGILRVNHKMIVSAPPKAGKSFLLIELAIAIAEGMEWLGHRCRQGRVLYINLELDDKSCARRFSDVYRALCPNPTHCGFVERWNLRGRSMPLDKLAPKLIRRACRCGFSAIIIDPVYKVMTGDENSSEDVSEFTRHYDAIARGCGCSLVFCHHHSKGAQGDKRSMDRASGSGVFSRDQDAIIDLLPLESEAAKGLFMGSYERDAMAKAADILDPTGAWRKIVSQDASTCSNTMEGNLIQIFKDPEKADAIREAKASVGREFDSVTGWRASFTLREFASPSPVNLWFKWPIHIIDGEGNLKDATPEGQQQTHHASQKSKGRGSANKTTKAEKIASFKSIIESSGDDRWTIARAVEQFQITIPTVRKYCKDLGWPVDNGTIVVPKAVAKQEDLPDDCPF